jgi:hypothetical protein
LIVDAEVAVNIVSVLVQEFQVLGVASLLESKQKLAESVVQILDVTRGDEIRKCKYFGWSMVWPSVLLFFAANTSALRDSVNRR